MASAAELAVLDGVRLREDSWRFDVLDRSLDVIGEVRPLRGVDVESNINRTVKRSCSGVVLTAADRAALDPFGDRLRPVWRLGGVDYPLGVFLVADLGRTVDSSGGHDELTLLDGLMTLAQPLSASYGLQEGVSITAAMGTLAAEANVPAYEVDASSAKVGAPIAWPAGRATRLEVLNDLARLAGFHSAYFDNAGVLRLRKAVDLGAVSEPDFDYDRPARVYPGSIVEADDSLTAPNEYLVLSTSATDLPVVGRWQVPAEAPHSFERRGWRSTKVLDVQGVESDEAAAEAARVAGQADDRGYAWASFAAAPDPRHDTFDVVRWSGVLWREQSWRLRLEAGGEHRHELRRVYSA